MKFRKIFFITIITTTIIYTSISNSLTTKSIKESSHTLVKSGLIYNDDNSYTDIFKTILKLTPLTEQQIINLINLDYINNILVNLVDSIYEYNLTLDNNVKYSKEKIISLVEDNLDKSMKDINYNLSNEDKTEVINYTNNNIDYIIDTIYKTDVSNWRN